MFNPLSVAAACNSKLKLRQKRLRSANPQALLILPPKGAWITNCIPPPSSKKRSATTVFCVGTEPNTARPCRMYSIACSAAESSSPHSCFSHCTAEATLGLFCEIPTGGVSTNISLVFWRSSATCAESSSVRAGASPRQKGTLGGAPSASWTSTAPALDATRRIIHDVFPSKKQFRSVYFPHYCSSLVSS